MDERIENGPGEYSVTKKALQRRLACIRRHYHRPTRSLMELAESGFCVISGVRTRDRCPALAGIKQDQAALGFDAVHDQILQFVLADGMLRDRPIDVIRHFDISIKTQSCGPQGHPNRFGIGSGKRRLLRLVPS